MEDTVITCTLDNRDIYEGRLEIVKLMIKENLFESMVLYMKGNLKIMEGNLNGQGKYTNSDVDTYEGEIKNNEYNGEGKLCNSKNRCISRGVFENGQLKRGTHYV